MANLIKIIHNLDKNYLPVTNLVDQNHKNVNNLDKIVVVLIEPSKRKGYKQKKKY